MDTPIITVLQIFVERRVSALPIVDEKGRVIDIYAKFDVFVSILLGKCYHAADIKLVSSFLHVLKDIKDQIFLSLLNRLFLAGSVD